MSTHDLAAPGAAFQSAVAAEEAAPRKMQCRGELDFGASCSRGAALQCLSDNNYPEFERILDEFIRKPEKAHGKGSPLRTEKALACMAASIYYTFKSVAPSDPVEKSNSVRKAEDTWSSCEQLTGSTLEWLQNQSSGDSSRSDSQLRKIFETNPLLVDMLVCAAARDLICVFHTHAGQEQAAEKRSNNAKQICDLLSSLPGERSCAICVVCGLSQLVHGQYEEAVASFCTAIQVAGSESASPAIRAAIGFCYFSLSDFDMAVKAFERATTLEPRNPEYRAALLEARRALLWRDNLSNRNRSREADKKSQNKNVMDNSKDTNMKREQAESASPTDDAAWAAAELAESFKAAAEIYASAPASPNRSLLLRISNSLFFSGQMGKHEETLEAVRRRCFFLQTCGAYRYQRGRCHHYSGRYREAIEEYSATTALNPAHAAARISVPVKEEAEARRVG
eukprot:GHVU01139981.1.p1 GENE.GHVU01139981.1~~GHVU01139981.1.p1  ORF type:complete len:452 (+),score=74.88 GHVU01139981.1:264-1619(+)